MKDTFPALRSKPFATSPTANYSEKRHKGLMLGDDSQSFSTIDAPFEMVAGASEVSLQNTLN